ASRIRLFASETFSETTERFATVDPKRFSRAPRLPRAEEMTSRIESATSNARLAADTEPTLRLDSVELLAVVVPAPGTAAACANTEVTLPPARRDTPPRATTFSVATAVVKP